MKLVAAGVAALAALAMAKIPSGEWEQQTWGDWEAQGIQETSFKRGSEYHFRYNGQVATGIPGSSRQHAATRVQAAVSIVLKGENKALLKIQSIRMGRLNAALHNPRALAPFMAFEEVEIQEEQKDRLQLPLMFTYDQGVVEDLVLDGREQPWSANIKKGILNMLQVNLGKRNQMEASSEAALLNQMPQEDGRQDKSDFFATQEKTVEGECQTIYSVTSQPNQPQTNDRVLNVTRSVDFENCKQRPEIKYQFRFQDPCTNCDAKYQEDQKFLKSSSVGKFNISGTAQEFLIQSAIVESQYQLVPFNRDGNVISTYINQTMELIRAGSIVSKNIRQPKNPQQSDSDLMYTLDWDKDMEEFLMKGHNQARLPVEIKGRVQMVKEILEGMVGEMRECVGEQVPFLYARLVKVFRMAEKQQLEEIFQQLSHSSSFSQEQQHKVQALLTDALADAGTKDSVSLLLHLIKQQKISPLRASLTIKHLNNIRTPSKEIIREMMAFLEEPVVQENFVLKQAAFLTLGSMVQGLCMPSEERLAILPRPSNEKTPRRLGPNTHLCPQQLQDQILQKLFAMVEEGKQSEEKVEEAVLGLKTIGNMGLPKAVRELEQIIRGSEDEQQVPQTIRIEAIMALRQLREVLPRKIQQILIPIFMNKQERNEERMAAAYQVFQTQPSRPVLDQMARGLFAERSQQVASFVFSYMQTLANSSNPCEKRFAKDLKLALRHGRQIGGAFRPQFSKVLHGSAHSETYRLGGDAEIISVISNKTFLPRYLALDIHANAAGFWSKYLAGVSVAQENLESLINRFMRRTELNDINLEDILSRNSRGGQNPVKELKKIWSQLSTVQRSLQGQGSPMAFATLKLKDQEFWMAPMTAKSIKSLPSIQHIRRVLSEGAHFNVQKAGQLHEMEYKIPTAIGMPIVVKVAIPTVAQISGQVRIQTQNPMKAQLNNMKPSVASSLLTSVTAWSPVVASGLKVVATAKFCAPATAKAQLDIKGRMPSLRLSIEPVQKNVEWIRLETRPMTFTRKYQFPLTQYPKAQYKTIPGEEWNRAINVRDLKAVQTTEKTLEAITGQEIRVEGVWHRTPANGPAFLPVCPFSGPNHFSIKTKPTQDQPKEFVLKISAKNFQQMSQDIQSEQWEMEDEEDFMSENMQTKGFQTTIKTELYTKGAAQEKRAEMETEVKFSPDMRLVKAESEVSVSPIRHINQQQIKACLKGFVQYPQAAENFQQLSGKAAVASAKATWGQGQCQEHNRVEVKIGAKHSQQQQQQWEEEPELSFFADEEGCQQNPARCSPVNLRGVLRRPQQLLNYVAVAKFNNISPIVKNATNAVFRALKTYYYWNSEEINFGHNNPSGIIRAQMTVEPRGRQLFNLTVKTPVENVTLREAKLPVPLVMPVSIGRLGSRVSSPEDLLENIYGAALPQCQINSARVKTFDQSQFRAPISDCWTLLSKDCDDETNPAYAVLVKAIQQGSSQKALKIVTRKHKVEIRPDGQAYDSLKVKINGKAVQQDQLPENQQIRFQQEGQALKVVLPAAGVRVLFDGYTAQVQVSPMAASAQCGLCGHLNFAQDDDFITPQNEAVSDIRRFIQANTIKHNGCQFPEELEAFGEDEELAFQEQWEQEDRYTDSSEEEEQEENWSSQPAQSVAPVKRLVAQEEEGKLCISAQAVPRCPADSFPQQYEEEEREVTFKCLSLRHHNAHRILRAVQHQSPRSLPQDIKEDLDQLSESYTAQVPAPKRCGRGF